jgi:hypothetical protein
MVSETESYMTCMTTIDRNDMTEATRTDGSGDSAGVLVSVNAVLLAGLVGLVLLQVL